MADQYPQLDSNREQQLAQENAAKLLGSEESAQANKEFSDALNKNSEKEQDILLKVAGALEDLASHSEVQSKAELTELKSLASDVATEFNRVFMASSTTAEDIDNLGKRLSEVLKTPERAGASSGVSSKFAAIQSQAEGFAQIITDSANSLAEQTDRLQEVTEDLATQMDRGRAAPMVGEASGAGDPTFQPGGRGEAVSKQLGDLSDSITSPIVESLSSVTKGIAATLSSAGDPLLEFMMGESRKNDEREKKRDKVAADASKGPPLSERLQKAVKGGMVSAFGEPIKLLGMLAGTLVALKSELLLSFKELLAWGRGLWPQAKTWLSENLGWLGDAIGVVGDEIGWFKDEALEYLQDLAADVGRRITDAMSLTKSKEELKTERSNLITAKSGMAAQKMIRKGGPSGKLIQEALSQGAKPAHAMWFGSMATTDQSRAEDALGAYNAALAAGQSADEAFKAVRSSMHSPEVPVSAAPPDTGTSAADQSAQIRMSKQPGADSAEAIGKLAQAVNQQNTTLNNQLQQQKMGQKGDAPQTMDTIGVGDSTGLVNYAAGTASGGVI